MFHPKKISIAMTQASCVCICTGERSYYVFLMMGGGTDRWFLLARPALMGDARTFAQEMAAKLDLPVKETTFTEMRVLS